MGKLHKLVAGTAVMTAVAVGFTTLADADTYTVKSGDTLWDIARNNGTTVEQLMKDNNLTSSLIFPGDQLSYQTTATQVANAQSNGEYKVVLGDTLFKIANKFGTTVDNLVALNKISNPNLIMVGQVIKVSGTVETPVVVEEVKEVKEVVEPKPVAQPAPQPQAEVVETPVVVEEVKEVVEPKPVAQPAPQPVVQAQPVAVQATSNKAATIFAAAKSQLGVYQDCTMLVTNALRAAGINFHDWPAGYLSLGTVVSAAQAQPGDLVYYANGGMGLAHVAVYAGNGQAIHGGWNGNQTVINTVYLGSGPVFVRVR